MKIETMVTLGLLGFNNFARRLSRSYTTVLPAGKVTGLDAFRSETRTKEVKETLKVPTKEGLMASLDISILYRIDPTKADEIYKTLGINYQDAFLIPTLRNTARDVIANFQSEDLYNTTRRKIALDINSQLKITYQQRGIILEDVLLRDVTLLNEVTSAIERKISAKQASEQMQYVLDKEK